jgi:hypothetical protein
LGEVRAAAKLRDPELNDLDHVGIRCTAVLVLFQRRGNERDVDQRRNAIISHHFGACSPNPFEQYSIWFNNWHDVPLVD